MDKLDSYRVKIISLLEKYGVIRVSSKQISFQLIKDTINDHYILFLIGWDGIDRVYGSMIHIDIIGEKVWIQHNGTDLEIADELVELGIPKKDIVLAFHHPKDRKYTGFSEG